MTQHLNGRCGGTEAADKDQPGWWAGIYPTVVTPFHAGGGIDTAALERQVRYQMAGGVRGLLLLGTVGEGEYVDDQERAQVVSTAVRSAGPAARVVVGVQTCDLGQAHRQVLQARDLGASAALVKYLGNPGATHGEVLRFYESLADLRALPLLYYHFPGHTGLRPSAEAAAEVLALPGVVGIKESVINLHSVRRRLRLAPGKAFFSGTALNLTQFLAIGGHGAMCPEAVVLPRTAVKVFRAYRQGRRGAARGLQKKMYKVLHILRKSILPARGVREVLMRIQDLHLPWPLGVNHPEGRLKAALTFLGVPTSEFVRGPSPSLTSWDRRRIGRALERLREMGLLDGGPQALEDAEAALCQLETGSPPRH